jgi:hypothetical protein
MEEGDLWTARESHFVKPGLDGFLVRRSECGRRDLRRRRRPRLSLVRWGGSWTDAICKPCAAMISGSPLRSLFIMRGASLKYRLQLPGFVLPEAVTRSLRAYDECSAQMLENMADRMEGETSQATPMSAKSSTLLGQTLESCRADESRLLLSEDGATFVPLLRQIDRLTSRLADQIAMESDRPD